MKGWLKLALHVTFAALYVAVGWMAGLALLSTGSINAIKPFLRTRRALAPSIACPWCHEDVPQYGPYTCASCRARTLGWAWRCPACAAWAGHIECPHCGLSITNPILGAP